MGQKRVTLHFSKSDTSSSLSAFNGLLCEIVDRTRCTDLVLVRDHVPQTLIVYDANVNIRFKFLAGNSRVHGLVSIVIEASGRKFLPEKLGCGMVLIKLEWCRVLGMAMERPRLCCQGLDKHTNGHTRWEGMRIDNDIWHNPSFRERHVNRGPLLGNNTLLSVT
jgi:hypothetical protein